MKTARMFPQPLILSLMLMLFAAACAHHPATPSAGSQAANASITSAELPDPPPPMQPIAPGDHREIRIEGEFLTLPQGTAGAEVIPHLCAEAGSISEASLATLMKVPETELLLRPRILVRNGEVGRFNVIRDNGAQASIQSLFRPVFQADGKVLLYVAAHIHSLEYSPETTVTREVLVTPNDERHTFIGTLTDGKKKVLIFINTVTPEIRLLQLG